MFRIAMFRGTSLSQNFGEELTKSIYIAFLITLDAGCLAQALIDLAGRN